MIGEPWFWREKTFAARAVRAGLAPLAFAYEKGGALRRRWTTPWRASVPVICVGNATVGGVGKTPFAIMIARLLAENGVSPHFLSRGYGGELKGPIRVDGSAHTAREVGDEPLLLARAAPTWVSRSKRAGAEAAIAAGAEAIIMDDGFQNPTLAKDVSILLIDERSDGSEKIFPAGPMREPMDAARTRADMVVAVSAKQGGDSPHADFAAWLEPARDNEAGRVVAFCGIARPERFFAALERADFDIADAIAFPDHYAYSRKNIAALLDRAKRLKARIITTEKDWVRIAPDQQDLVDTFPVRMKISDADAFKAALLSRFKNFREPVS